METALLRAVSTFGDSGGFMFKSDIEGWSRNGDGETALDTFLFVGAGLVFPGSLLRIVEQEAGGVQAIRLDDMRRLPEARLARNWQVRKVFFDDRVADDVLRNFDDCRAAFPDAAWILAYRELATARDLLSARARMPGLAGILLLPMILPICLWTSMLRLVLADQFIAEGDLIGATAARDPQPAQPQDHRRQMQAAMPEVQGVPDGQSGSTLRLTQREREVLALVSQGERNKSIANTMSLSEHTVKLHLHNAITKIGARNRTEAATWYLSNQTGDRR